MNRGGRAAVGLAAALLWAGSARAQSVRGHWPMPDGAALVRLLGPRATDAFTVRGGASREIRGRVVLPAGVHASDVGLRELVPGLARLSGSPASIVAFADAHPDLPIEVTPPLHTLLNSASGFVFANQAIEQGLDGSGVLVGVADTGLDVTHPDFLDAQGHTRVAWLLDLSAPPRGVHADLEAKFGIAASTGPPLAGAVWSGADIDAAIAAGDTSKLPQDEVGHGTLVTACAAANGLGGSKYRGIAPGATILLARITGSGTESIDTDDVLLGASFLFDRATALGKPVVVNLSLGSDFGPHDGTMAWEQALASFIGPDHPGRALVAAAGNSGSIAPGDGPLVHQNVYVTKGATTRVPIPTVASQEGGVQIWVAMHSGADLRVGLDGPDGTWIAPVASADSAGKQSGGYQAAVYNGSNVANSPVPAQSHGAVVAWQGAWPGGTYDVTLSGSGTADLYIQGTGDASSPGGLPLGFAEGVRESTINLPATVPSIIGVGCTINKTGWVDEDGHEHSLAVPLLDPVGGAPNPDGLERRAAPGEPCWFSSAGPTLTGVAKPDIMAPGAAIVGALSQQAVPPAPESIFSDTLCGTTHCEQIDSLHGVSAGTSFSAPIVAGTVAVMLQHDPTLTEDTILAALQGGAHPLRGAAPFDDQAGAGEVDVLGAIAAVDRLRDPALSLPAPSASWLTLGADLYLADGSTPLEAVLELRAARTSAGAMPADGFAQSRLSAYALVDGRPAPGAAQLARRGPGVWVLTVQLPPGLGLSQLTVGATFDGEPIVEEKTVPIATDVWAAEYPASIRGGCAMASSAIGRSAARDREAPDPRGWGGALALAALALVRRRA
ncbi:MAG TPA: S8 family serine peptidase [Polyangiaceae bacterium]|nr:S8 family serine peptidase [Polyangiaceae bacterium]